MKLHEYQAKEILKQFGINVPNGQVVSSSDEAIKVARILNGPWVVKAQVHAGGRSKAGGVKFAHYPYEVVTATESLINKSLTTKQTGAYEVTVQRVLIEESADILRELYLGMVTDRSTAKPTMIFSKAGGMDIEEIAAQSPEHIQKEYIDPAAGWLPHQARNLIYMLKPLPSIGARRLLMSVMANVYKLFIALDCTLLEINPLVTTKDGQVLALDAKINIDDNALFRQKEYLHLEDFKEKDPLELMAEKYQLNYIRLNGNIGAMVNGAGLAMATMDIIKMAGAEPANFLDVGGGANEDMITKGFEIILKDRGVKAILVNIFGGILRCDVLARGVLAAAQRTHIRIPLIIRLEGTNVEEGRKILKNSEFKFLIARDLTEAIKLVSKQV